MTQTSRNGGRPAATTQELRADVAYARDELAETVSQLAAKADIKSRARARAKETRSRMRPHQGRHGTEQGGGKQGAMLAAGAGTLALVVLAAILYRQRHA